MIKVQDAETTSLPQKVITHFSSSSSNVCQPGSIKSMTEQVDFQLLTECKHRKAKKQVLQVAKQLVPK